MRALPHPVSRRSELLEGGWTQRQVDHALRTGALHRLRRGVYTGGPRFGRADRATRHRLDAVGLGLVLAASEGAVSHASAAVLLGLPMPFGATPAWGTVRPALSTRYGQGTTVLAATLADHDVRANSRIRRTSLARTVSDCLRHLSTVDAVAIADAALHRDPGAWVRVRRALEECAGWPFHRRGVAAWALVDGRRESPLESWTWVAAARQGLPLPEPQVSVHDEHGTFLGRVDAWWPEHGVVGEVDGLSKYGMGVATSDPAALRTAIATVVQEKTREDLLRRTGLHVVRWGAGDLRQERRWARLVGTELGRGNPSAVRAHLLTTEPTHPLDARFARPTHIRAGV